MCLPRNPYGARLPHLQAFKLLQLAARLEYLNVRLAERVGSCGEMAAGFGGRLAFRLSSCCFAVHWEVHVALQAAAVCFQADEFISVAMFSGRSTKVCGAGSRDGRPQMLTVALLYTKSWSILKSWKKMDLRCWKIMQHCFFIAWFCLCSTFRSQVSLSDVSLLPCNGSTKHLARRSDSAAGALLPSQSWDGLSAQDGFLP